MKKQILALTITLCLMVAGLMTSCNKSSSLEEEPCIIVKTDKFIAERLSFSFAAISNDVYIDWGEGKREAADFVKTENPIGRRYAWQINRSRIKGQTIKIYGSLISFICIDNRISELEIKNCPELKYLDCSKNRIKKLDISNCKKLELFYISNNQIEDIDLSNNKGLINLFCDNNKLRSIDLTSLENLKILNCSKNEINSIDISKCLELSELYCKETKITHINKEKHPNLKIYDK